MTCSCGVDHTEQNANWALRPQKPDIRVSIQKRICGYCGRKYRTWHRWYEGDSSRRHFERSTTNSLDMAQIDPTGCFCTMRCAAKFGAGAVRLADTFETEEYDNE